MQVLQTARTQATIRLSCPEHPWHQAGTGRATRGWWLMGKKMTFTRDQNPWERGSGKVVTPRLGLSPTPGPRRPPKTIQADRTAPLCFLLLLLWEKRGCPPASTLNPARITRPMEQHSRGPRRSLITKTESWPFWRKKRLNMKWTGELSLKKTHTKHCGKMFCHKLILLYL